MEHYLGLLAGVCVGLINVFLNIFVKNSANNNGSFFDSLFSMNFFYAFLIGLTSIIAMLLFYYYASKINLGQALLLMASSSLIFGILINYFYFKKSIEPIECIIFFTLLTLYIFKFSKTLN